MVKSHDNQRLGVMTVVVFLSRLIALYVIVYESMKPESFPLLRGQFQSGRIVKRIQSVLARCIDPVRHVFDV